MKLLLLCNACGHSESLNSAWEVHECPKCKSAKIEVIPYSKSRSTTELKVFFGIIGAILQISGIILMLGSYGSMVSGILYPLGVTFVVIGLLIWAIIVGTLGKDKSCWTCLAGC